MLNSYSLSPLRPELLSALISRPFGQLLMRVSKVLIMVQKCIENKFKILPCAFSVIFWNMYLYCLVANSFELYGRMCTVCSSPFQVALSAPPKDASTFPAVVRSVNLILPLGVDGRLERLIENVNNKIDNE